MADEAVVLLDLEKGGTGSEVDVVGGFEAVEGRIKAVLGDGPAAWIVARYFAETTGRAAEYRDDGTVFLITGDIPAMWLRDSAAQVMPFLRLDDAAWTQDFVVGVLRRQLEFIVLDPYANAFNARPYGAEQKDAADPSLRLWERKYEVDSLCFPLLVAYRAWRRYGRTDIFDALFWRAVGRVLDTLEIEQDHQARSAYRFRRLRGPFRGLLSRAVRVRKVGVTGMTWSGFRPSDDACHYGYNVPGNMFVASVLGHLAEIAAVVDAEEPTEAQDTPDAGARAGSGHHADTAERALRIRAEIEAGIRDYAVIDDPVTGPRWAYEVDGLGGVLEMDDANMPSLLALPMIGYCRADDPLYLATRAFVLSDRDPYFYRGTAATGVGSPHTRRRYIWPIALSAAALTSTNPADKRAAIDVLLSTDGGTTRIHESFHADNPKRWTREWFSWAEAMFAELVLETCGYTYPETATRR